VGGGEVHVGEDVLLGAIHQGRELWDLWPQLVGHRSPLPPGALRIGFRVGGADPGRDDAALALPGMRQRSAGEMNAGAVEKAAQF
jgi:hypothetical protein